jgi:hypothetical protein
VQCYGLDLTLFQLDFGQTWNMMFFNADRTIYGRCGTRSAMRGVEDVTIEGFKETLKRVLALHEAYPGNRRILKGKKGPPPRWKTPEDYPLFRGTFRRAEETGDQKELAQNCVWCHWVRPGRLLARWQEELPLHERDLWDFPMPRVLGLHLEPERASTVQEVEEDSKAEKAGFEVGDTILEIGGQPVVSIADVQWVLHRAPVEGALTARVLRRDEEMTLTLPLPEGWRRRWDFTWRASAGHIQQKILGLTIRPVVPQVRTRLDLEEGEMAYRVRALMREGTRFSCRAARDAGVRQGDLVVGIDGWMRHVRKGQIFAYLLLAKRPGDTITLTVLRNGAKKDLVLKLPKG